MSKVRIISEDGNQTKYACGCITDIVGDKFVVIPHSLDCEVYKFCVEESERQNHPVREYRQPSGAKAGGASEI